MWVVDYVWLIAFAFDGFGLIVNYIFDEDALISQLVPGMLI